MWRQRPKDRIHQIFLLFTVSLSLWVLTGILSNLETARALLLNKLVFIFPLIVVWSAMYLTILLSKNKTRAYIVSLTGISVVVASALILVSQYVVQGIIARHSATQFVAYDIERGSGYPLYVIYLTAIAIIALVVLSLRWKRASRREKDQLSLVGFGLLGCLLSGLFTSVFLPIVTGSSEFASYSFLSGLIATVFFAYAIVKYDLFDIKLVAVRSVAYGAALILLSAIYYLAAYLLTIIFFHDKVTSSVSVSPVNILLALVLAFAFQPIKSFFDQLTDSIFYRGHYSAEDFFANISQRLTNSHDLRLMLEQVSDEIAVTIKAEYAQFFVYYQNERRHHLSAGTLRHRKIPLSDARMLDKYFANNRKIKFLQTDFVDDGHTRRMLVSHGINLVVSLHSDKQVGYLILGDQQSSGYKDRDIKILLNITDELVIGIQNALSLHQVKELNATLQQRIDVATKELRSSNAQLKHLDEVKDEFMSMASHQLRTPLTSIKGYLSMVLDGDVGKISPQQRTVLSEAFNSSERMVHLISDFLNVSRLQTGKFVIEKALVDFGELVRQEIADLEGMAKGRELHLEFKSVNGELQINADAAKLREVVTNFIDNAIYYSPEHTKITVHVEKDHQALYFSVVDQGIGVPEAEQARLFNKFFRATNARKQRPDGTGVGLYLARKVITAHGGAVVFESKEGKGSTFGFRLPLAKSTK